MQIFSSDQRLPHFVLIDHHFIVHLICVLNLPVCGLTEGVQLLCLIDKAADACRYLQTYGEWNRAAWLAKVTQHDDVHQQETLDSV